MQAPKLLQVFLRDCWQVSVAINPVNTDLMTLAKIAELFLSHHCQRKNKYQEKLLLPLKRMLLSLHLKLYLNY